MSYSSLILSSKIFKFTALALALSLAGCGGGGTDTIAPEPDFDNPQPGNGGNNGGGNNGGGDPTNPISEVNITPISLKDANGNMTRTVSASGANAQVKVTDRLGNPISSALVNFSGEGVNFGTSNGSVLTNEAGEASISLKPANSTDTGSYQLKATTNVNDSSATTPAYNFSIQSTNVILTNVALSSTNLNSGASTNITLRTKDAVNNVFQNDIAVDFNTSCGTFDATNVSSSNQGNITAVYTAIDANGNLCAGSQTISITPTNTPANRQVVTVNIAAVEASSIVYTTTENVQLGASGSGSSSSGQIEFTVFANGRPAANQRVEISRSFAPSDFSFVTLNNRAPKIITSDSQGRVVVNVYPGALPGPVEIKATLVSNTDISALSKNVSVATGRATQNGFSISLSKNVLSRGADGDTATLTARLVDRVGNPIPDGTVVSFVSEGGRVIPNCSISDSKCSVEFSTQNPRPVDDRISIIAFVEGDKSYTDINGDNSYTVGVDSLIRNIGEFFRDDNENNQYDSVLGEFVYRRDAANLACGQSSFTFPNINQTCDNRLDAILRYQVILGLASDTPLFPELGSTIGANPLNDLDSPIDINFRMYGNSAQTVSMPSGTSISIAAVDKTSFSPTATLANNIITVSNAEPNTVAVVTAGSSSVNVNIGTNGSGSASSNGIPAGTALAVADKSSTCEVELFGISTVPSVVNLGAGLPIIGTNQFGKVLNSEVSYTFSYSGCRPNDQIKLTTTTPAPSANTFTKTIRVVR